MIYRIQGLVRSRVDLKNSLSGACFLVGGGYQLPDVRTRLNDPRIFTMGMNNAATQFTPNLWTGADSPDHYSPGILFNPTIMKFIYMKFVDFVVNGKPMSSLTNAYFMPWRDAEAKHFFSDRPRIGWWGNVFTLALELLHYLGFRTIYIVGAGLHVDDRGAYGYESDLEDDELEFNQCTYDSVVRQVRCINEASEAHHLDLISCTPDSRLNKFLTYAPFDDAFGYEVAMIPEHQTTGLKRPSHSGLRSKLHS